MSKFLNPVCFAAFFFFLMKILMKTVAGASIMHNFVLHETIVVTGCYCYSY